MEVRKIVVIVEDVEVSRTALQWALHNLLRHGDLVTLLHFFSPHPISSSSKSKSKSKSKSSKISKKKLRLLRLNGFQLALSFKDLCHIDFPNTNIEIVVTEGDRDGKKIAATVRDIGASTLIVGLHDRSFLYRLAMSQTDIANNFNCKVLAIKQPQSPFSFNPNTKNNNAVSSLFDVSTTNMDFSQIQIAHLEDPEVLPTKIRYKICPSPYAIIWRSRRRARRKSSS